MNLKRNEKWIASIVAVLLSAALLLPGVVGCGPVTTGSAPETSPAENGSLETPRVELSPDPEKAPAPENPELSLLETSKKQYANGNIGCTQITVLAEYNVGIDYDIYSYRDTESKIFYLFIPCRADMSKITFSVTHREGSVSGPYTVDFSDEETGDNERVYGTTSLYTVVALQSNLPTMMVQVDEFYGTLKSMYNDKYHDTYVYGDMVTTLTDEVAMANGWSNRYESVDEKSDKNCSMNMRGRGNATWGYTKRPYQIKTENDLDLIGMGNNDTFVLLANYNDGSFLRNQLALELGLALGMDYTSQCRQIDLFINGEYMGLYLLAEKCDVGENRIEIDQHKDILYEINQRYEEYGEFGFLSNYDNLGKVRIHSPEDSSRLASAKSIFYRAERALYGNDEEEFLLYFDLESWAKMYIIQELTMNHDAYWGSLYFYYDHTDGKIHACAPWDFDYALGISWADQTNAEAKDKVENPTRYSVDSHYMIKQMLNFETFRYAVLEVYSRQSTQKAINEFKTNIELFAEQNRASANMNFVGSTYRVKNFPYEYDEALEYIRSIIHTRVEWFDNKMKNFS